MNYRSDIVIVCDTREQKNDHILKWFERHGIPYVVRTIDTADYMVEGNGQIRCDRKQNLNELAHNLLSRDRGRFYREIRRARDAGIHLFVVCEHGHGVESIQDVSGWQNPYGKVTGKTLREAIYKCAIAYGCEFIFCNRRQTGKVIYQILTEGKYEK